MNNNNLKLIHEKFNSNMHILTMMFNKKITTKCFLLIFTLPEILI